MYPNAINAVQAMPETGKILEGRISSIKHNLDELQGIRAEIDQALCRLMNPCPREAEENKAEQPPSATLEGHLVSINAQLAVLKRDLAQISSRFNQAI